MSPIPMAYRLRITQKQKTKKTKTVPGGTPAFFASWRKVRMTNMFCDDEVKPIKGMMFPKLYRDPQGLKDMHRGIAGHLGIEGGAAPQM